MEPPRTLPHDVGCAVAFICFLNGLVNFEFVPPMLEVAKSMRELTYRSVRSYYTAATAYMAFVFV